MPGVLQVEAMAQAASLLVLRQPEHTGKMGYFMSADGVKFRKPVTPGDTLFIHVEITKGTPGHAPRHRPLHGQRRDRQRSGNHHQHLRALNAPGMDSHIHPTSVIDPAARLGTGVHVGPYCVIGAGVVLGDRCRLHGHVVLAGPAVIGADNEFYPFAAIGHRSQDLKYTGEPTYLEIGDRNTFREFVTVHRATAPGGVTRIGHGGNFLAYSHIAHDCLVGDEVIFSNNGTLAGHVEVGDRAVIGGLTAVHQFCRIGRMAITGGCSKIVQTCRRS